MPLPRTPQISKDDLATLETLSNILHLFNHRNKNQHRHSIWWRHFSVFRRQFDRLLQDTRTLNTLPTTNVERVKKKAQDPQTRERVSQRLDFWQDVLVAKWQHAFSQVIADGRFAVLGLVLQAALAQTCRINGITAQIEEVGQTEVERVLEEFGREQWGSEVDGLSKKDAVREDVGVAITRPADDECVAISRDDITIAAEKIRSTLNTASPRTAEMEKVGNADTTRKRPAPAPKKVSKKKKQKGDAIDQLFSGW